VLDPAGFDALAVLVAALIGVVLGAAWYSPLLFGDAWMAALGRSREELGAPGPAMAGSVVACLVSAAAVEWLVTATGTHTALAGAGLGAVLGLGVVATALLSDSLFSGTGLRLFLIQMGYRAGYLVLMGAICGAWAG